MGTQYETQYKDGETPDHISSEFPGKTQELNAEGESAELKNDSKAPSSYSSM